MTQATIIVAKKEFLKGRTERGRPWALAKIQDGETQQWFVTFDVDTVFEDISFKDLSAGDLLRIEYEQQDNGKYQDLVLRGVRRPEFFDQDPIEDSVREHNSPENPEGTSQLEDSTHSANNMGASQSHHLPLSDYFTKAREIVSEIANSLPSGERPISQESRFKAIVQIALEWMYLEHGGRHGDQSPIRRNHHPRV